MADDHPTVAATLGAKTTGLNRLDTFIFALIAQAGDGVGGVIHCRQRPQAGKLDTNNTRQGNKDRQFIRATGTSLYRPDRLPYNSPPLNAQPRGWSNYQSLNQESFMLRLIVPTAAIAMALSFSAQAASLKEQNLNKELRNIAAQSSVGTPRAINEDILDQGYTVEGVTLINHLSVQASHAEKMRADPKAVYFQLGASVCNNPSYRKLMAKGAIMRYDFSEYKTNKAIGSASYQDSDCPKAAPAKK